MTDKHQPRTGTHGSSGEGTAVPAAALAWILLVTCLWLALGWRLRINPPLFDTSTGALPGEQLAAFATWALLALSSLGWGAWVGQWLGILPSRGVAARMGVALLLGHTVAALIVFLIGALRLYPWGVLVLLVGLGGLPGEWRAWRAAPPVPRPRGVVLSTLWVVVALACALTFVVAFAPVTESDGIRYHLVGPQEWLKAGGLVHLPHQAFTNLPAQTNMLYLAGMAVADSRVAQVIHWTYLPLVMLFGGLLTERLLRALHASRRGAEGGTEFAVWSLFGGALAGMAPVTLVLASWPFVDLSTLAFSLAAIWAVVPGSLPRLGGRLLLSGILCGAAIGTKLTALFAVLPIGALVLVLLAARRNRLAHLARFVLPIVIVAGPWFAKCLVYHGNPVYPAGYSVFGGAEWSDIADAIYKSRAGSKGFGRSPADLLLSPLDVTIRWSGFPNESPPRRTLFGKASPGYEDQNPGPALLALMPIALVGLMVGVRRRRASPILWLVLLQIVFGWLAWFATYQSVRFLLLQGALIAVAGVAVLAWMARSGWFARAAQAMLLAMAALGLAWTAGYHLLYSAKAPFAAALGIVDKHAYLSATLNFHDAVQWLNAEVQSGEKALYVGEHRALYADFEVLHADWFDTPRILVEIRATTSNEELLAKWQRDNVRYILWNQAELSLYERDFFRPRFSDAEWVRFEALRELLLRRERILFEPRPGVYVIALDR